MKLLDRFPAMAAAWAAVAARLEAYELVLPGAATFVCRADACSAHCCKAFSVALGEGEVARMVARSGRAPVSFLEAENGQLVTLPLARPYLLAHAEGRCRLLGDNLRCTQYHGRPDACRLYPHFIVTLDPVDGRLGHDAPAEALASVRALLRGEAYARAPLLVRHKECPGFTGPPMEPEAWSNLLLDVATIQFGEVGPEH